MLQISHPGSWEPERLYSIRVLLEEFLGLGYSLRPAATNATAITLAGDPAGRSLLVADDLFSRPETERFGGSTLPRTPLGECDLDRAGIRGPFVSSRLPVLYGRPFADRSYLRESSQGVELNIDVFGATYALLSRHEEIVCDRRDAHGRFPSSASIAARTGLLGRPIVNEYAELLWWALSRLWPRLERTRRDFRLVLSHDVDWPSSRGVGLRAFLSSAAADLIVRREPGLALRRTRSYALQGRASGHPDVYDTFDELMDVSEDAGVRGTFNFIAGHSGGRIDGAYSLDDPSIRSLLRRIHARGHEIGLHPSYHSFRDPARIRVEAERLRRVCEAEGIDQPLLGGRQHYLRWENPTTWQAWEGAGLAYDSTLGYSDRPGFRCGTCFEYPVFNVITRKALRLRERPLIVMEQAVLDRGSSADVIAELEEVKRRCRLFGGDFTLLWHNSRLLSRGERRAYAAALS